MSAAPAVVALVVHDVLAQDVLAQPAEVTEVINRAQLMVGAVVLGLAALFYSVAGLRMIFGGGDPAQVGQARDAIRNVSVGLLIVLAVNVVVEIVQYIAGTG
jgi:hypothetical protein